MDRIPQRQRITIAILVAILVTNFGFLVWAVYDSAVIHRENNLSITQRAESRFRLDRVEAWAAGRGYVPPTTAEIKRWVREQEARP